ncbi:ATP-binding protein [Candidatus Microgenomates bacterium]|nr:ATP-binding protein [Candidatus Microgenomates bacterium]
MKKDLLKTLLLDQSEQFKKKELGVTRENLIQIKKYANSSYAVVISGLRRVGKSTLLAQIAHKFYSSDDYYFVNFEDERFLNFTADDFNLLYETQLEFFGQRKIFLLDEVQNVIGWERFVRRMIDEGCKFYITGSNAALLSKELGTKLTGRYTPIELFPFSFAEFLAFKQQKTPNLAYLTTLQKSKLKRYFNDYIVTGGIPDALKYPEINLHKTLYDDVIYRDVAVRYKIEETKALKELSFYLISNISSLVSFNKLKELLKLGSVNTVKNYIDYLQTSWLMFTINKFAFSIKKQQIANKKIYAIDTGLIKSVAFSFSENRGKLLENLVFLTLRRLFEEIYYYTTQNDLEVDFYLPKQKILIQVCQSLADEETQKREVKALIAAMQELNINSAVILTEDEDSVDFENGKIKVIPMFKWLLDPLNN